ncbi:MAG TPA: hypothetical protein VHE99_06995 [Gammaproteobacteria bacterium]|nr:hypothetical protein [Gammaproteobacteria bacterium]
MGIEAAQQTIVAMSNLGWGMMSDVNNLDTIRDLGPKGKKVAEKLSAEKPHEDAFSGFYDLFDQHQSTRGTALLMQRLITAEMAKKDFSFGAELDLAECYKNLTAALQKNSALLKDYKELCATLQACRTDETARSIGQAGSLASKLLTSQTAPFIEAALGTTTVAGMSAAALATAGVAVGVALLAGGIAYKISDTAEKKEKTLRQEISQTTDEIGRQSNQGTAVVLEAMSHDAEYAKFDQFMQEAISAAKKNIKPSVGMDMLTDAQQLRGIQQQEYKYNLKELEFSLQHAKREANYLTTKLLATLDSEPVEKKPGALEKVKNVFKSKKTLKAEKDQDSQLQQARINRNREAIDSRIAAITEKVQVLEKLVNQLKGKDTSQRAEDTIKFHSGMSSSAALLQRLQTPLERGAQKVTMHVKADPSPVVKEMPVVLKEKTTKTRPIIATDFMQPPVAEEYLSLRPC